MQANLREERDLQEINGREKKLERERESERKTMKLGDVVTVAVKRFAKGGVPGKVVVVRPRPEMTWHNVVANHLSQVPHPLVIQGSPFFLLVLENNHTYSYYYYRAKLTSTGGSRHIARHNIRSQLLNIVVIITIF